MAVEAVMQILEVDGKQVSNLQNFELQHIRLDTALVIPDGDRGVEVLFNMQPRRRGKISDSYMIYQWLVTSITRLHGEEIFVEHAHGEIWVTGEDNGMSPCKLLVVGELESGVQLI